MSRKFEMITACVALLIAGAVGFFTSESDYNPLKQEYKTVIKLDQPNFTSKQKYVKKNDLTLERRIKLDHAKSKIFVSKDYKKEINKNCIDNIEYSFISNSILINNYIPYDFDGTDVCVTPFLEDGTYPNVSGAVYDKYPKTIFFDAKDVKKDKLRTRYNLIHEMTHSAMKSLAYENKFHIENTPYLEFCALLMEQRLGLESNKELTNINSELYHEYKNLEYQNLQDIKDLEKIKTDKFLIDEDYYLFYDTMAMTTTQFILENYDLKTLDNFMKSLFSYSYNEQEMTNRNIGELFDKAAKDNGINLTYKTIVDECYKIAEENKTYKVKLAN